MQKLKQALTSIICNVKKIMQRSSKLVSTQHTNSVYFRIQTIIRISEIKHQKISMKDIAGFNSFLLVIPVVIGEPAIGDATLLLNKRKYKE